MEKIYLVTGAAGHLGNVLARELVRLKQRVWVFIMPHEKNHVEGVEKIFYGDVTQKNSLMPPFIEAKGSEFIVIHCAGIVSIQSAFSQKQIDVNVGGTKNVADLCEEYKISRLIYISSVHALPEGPPDIRIKETKQFDPDQVVGQYAKTKAEATAYVLEVGSRGLHVNVVHPSGLIGPYDYGRGPMTTMIEDYAKGRLTSGMVGGYDFADVRDVVQGIISCSLLGRSGETYILSNEYYKIRELLEILQKITGRKSIRSYLPLWFVRIVAPLAELHYKVRKQPPLFTRYSIYTLSTDTHYNHEKATKELGYTTRDMKETLRDTYLWLKEQGRVSEPLKLKKARKAKKTKPVKPPKRSRKSLKPIMTKQTRAQKRADRKKRKNRTK